MIRMWEKRTNWIRGTVFGAAALMAVSGLSGCALKTAGGYYKDAMKYYETKNYTEAAASFEEAIARNPERAEYYIDYGLMKIQMGDYSGALEELDKAILDKDIKMVQANNKKAYRGKGIAYFNMLEYDRALEEFEKALAIAEESELDLDILAYKASICE